MSQQILLLEYTFFRLNYILEILEVLFQISISSITVDHNLEHAVSEPLVGFPVQICVDLFG